MRRTNTCEVLLMGGLFGGDTPTPAPVVLPEPLPMPEPPPATPMVDEASVARKKRLQVARSRQRGGRASTILSDSAETLGG